MVVFKGFKYGFYVLQVVRRCILFGVLCWTDVVRGEFNSNNIVGAVDGIGYIRNGLVYIIIN